METKKASFPKMIVVSPRRGYFNHVKYGLLRNACTFTRYYYLCSMQMIVLTNQVY